MSNEVKVKSVAGIAGKQVAGRIMPGTDLITGIEKICAEHGITAGWVNCIGSLQKAGYLVLVPKKSKLGAAYGDMFTVAGPVELMNGMGIICPQDGVVGIHYHATMCDKEGAVFGGHLVKGENPALATVELVINEIIDTQMERKYDEEAEGNHFSP